VIGLLVRALAERAEEVARLETGNPPEMVVPRPTRQSEEQSDATVEFRVKTWDAMGLITYVVTVSEVRGR
jgi:hypothetical protein